MKITIPKPCHENWNNMTTDEKGKFCSVCSKTVYDFTSFSDEELINTFDFNKDICGRFREDQLGINLNFSLGSKLALGLLTFGSFVATMNAQEIKLGEIQPPEKVPGVNMSVISTDSFNRNPSVRIGAPVLTPENRPLVLLDGKKISLEELRVINPETIETVNSLSAKDAVEKYGKEAKNGVIVITTKKKKKRR
ncbi:hypothetical protein BBH99_05165 [Chryseobacterium contaminans]|uniref:TonB-dependent Receptor Plug Domain n=1 Tax=Chryseobacterium contaminans TaxID=1423959 RepID=A0A1M7FSS8_9FLAO|nr:TonB-dependent receptor plug domain-containing protein [Chryseobacterium contaminans]OCA79837.1 hypothetical protein BBH99_05165 [Chryseobacterium contaminans]SHM06990.1 TonB-dependent Receptor Plug Domain [Chryseobacterium contaminans]